MRTTVILLMLGALWPAYWLLADDGPPRKIALELRVPYVDKEIVEYVERLPANLKVRNGTRKWLHRQVCHTYLPPSIIKRRKRGFADNVVDDWFRSSMQGRLSELLLDDNSLMYDLLDKGAVCRLLRDHQSGRHDYHKLLFSLVMIEQWLRESRSKQAGPAGGRICERTHEASVAS